MPLPLELQPKIPAAVMPLVKLLSREHAILEFNRRVLAQALRDDVPLLERLRYITIVSSNMDEFFEVRFANFIDAVKEEKDTAAHHELQSIVFEAHELIAEQYEILNEVLMPLLRQQGIQVMNHDERDPRQRAWVEQFFVSQVKPLLIPVGLDPSHPFPQVANKTLNFIVRLNGLDVFGKANSIAIVKVPRVLPRVIKLPSSISGGKQVFILLSSVIRAHLEELFTGRQVEAFSQFRVTRDSDIDVDEQDISDLLRALRSGLTTRNFGQAIRLEVVNTCPKELYEFLLQQFDLPEAALYKVNGPVNLVRLNQMIEQVNAPQLRFPAFVPSWPKARLPKNRTIMRSLQEHDVLLHHPFQSFEIVVQFLREAVRDPFVLAIKQTVYRAGNESAMMDLLIEAAQGGKEVMVVVELKARFDEEANINWAQRLEAVGAQVVYGVVGLKTHAKMLLITRREGQKLRHYGHLSTGNYNPKTALQYTDIGYLTAAADLTADLEAVFQQMASRGKIKPLNHLLQAPFQLQQTLLGLIKKVGKAAEQGQMARIVIKINALTDTTLIEALVAVAKQGVEIDLIVRGACALPSGLEATTEKIRVRSVIGRFLEHSRVLYFCWGTQPQDEALYLTSADWMNRNMVRRIEVAWPILDPILRQRLIDECLVPYLYDNQDAWTQKSDGTYFPSESGALSAQKELLRFYAN
jgi:polyphosphate kinase